MTTTVTIKNGNLVALEKGVKLDLIDATRAFVQIKEQLIKMYCGDGYPNSCEFLSSQIEDPSNEGRIYTVEI